MKKLFTLIASAFVAMAASAQVISFSEAATAGTLNGKTFSNGDFSIAITDSASKVSIDANSAYFGTSSEDKVKFEYRLKSGGKSSSKNKIKVTIPSDGTLNIYARTGSSSAKDRDVILTQGETALIDHILLESEAVTETYTKEDGSEATRNIYPIISAKVAAGEATITYPVGSINFYAFEFVSSAPARQALWSAPVIDGFYGPQTKDYPTVFEYTYKATITAYDDNTYTVNHFAGSQNQSFTFKIADDGSIIISDPAADSYGYNIINTGDKSYYAIGAYTTTYNGYKYSWTVGEDSVYYPKALGESYGEVGFYGYAYKTDGTSADDIWGYYCIDWNKAKYEEYTSINTVAAAVKPSAIYDLQGRQLSAKPAKGMYIQNGKKYLAK